MGFYSNFEHINYFMKKIMLIVLLFTAYNYASAQDVYTSSGKQGYQKKTKKKKGYDPDKLIIGGGLSAGFGDGYVAAGLSPILGYRFTDRFSAGIGLGYLYSQLPEFTDPSTNKTYYDKENILYPSIWGRYFVYRNIYVTSSVEYDIISDKAPSYSSGYLANETTTFTNTCLFLGAGARLPMGGRVFMYGEILYDVLQGENSPYAPGFPTTLRIGFAAGL
jgi:hypothetical protein